MVLFIIVVGVLVYAGIYYSVLSKQGLNPYLSNYQTPKFTPEPTQVPKPAIDTDTSKWKTFKFTDKNWFGYELKAPSNWSSTPWVGGHMNSASTELSQDFHGERCVALIKRIALLYCTVFLKTRN